MKTNCWLILGTMLATSAVAQVNTTQPPAAPATPPAAIPAAPVAPAVTPAPAPETKTNAPAKKVVKHHKAAAKKPVAKVEKEAAKLESTLPVVLVAGPATVYGETVNLRGQAGLKGEVVGHVKKGDTVTVISEINLDKPQSGEPAQWAKIALPASEKVWVNSRYVDTTNNVVYAKKLNLRGGPGENFSVLGVIEKGTPVTSLAVKGEWMQIQTPTNAFAFVAAGMLKQEAPAPVVVTPPVEPTPPPTPTPVPEPPVIAPPTTTPPVVAQVTPPPPPVTPVVPVPVITPTLPPPSPDMEDDANDTNLPPRVVTHEGSVRRSESPVAPSYFELFDPSSDKAIDYLYTSNTNLNLGRYNGMHITVTGQEALDPRWKDTPVLTVKDIHVISEPKRALKLPPQ